MQQLRLTVLAFALPLATIVVAPACANGGGEDGDDDDDDDDNDDDEHDTDHPAIALTGDATNGDAVYAASCASCHGADAQGGSGPSLASEVPEKSDNALAWIIAEGEEGMPAIDIPDQEIADVIAFLRAQFP